MTILLSAKNYQQNKDDINACRQGAMCKIMKIEDRRSGQSVYFISADIEQGGWTCRSGRAFHSIELDESCVRTGLGTFYLIRDMMTNDGGCLMEFTDDLNPDMP